MKLKLALTLLLLLFFSCENNNEDKKVSANLSNEQIVDLAESFDKDEESLTDDMDDAFSSFETRFKSVDLNSRNKSTGGATYDSTTGFWTKSFENAFTRIDSIQRDEHLVVRNMSIEFNKTAAVRFADAQDNSIQYPKDNKDHISKIEMNRNGTFTSSGTVSVYDAEGTLVREASERSGHKDKNGSVVLTKDLTDPTKWSLNGTGTKSVSFSSIRNGEEKLLEREVDIKMIDIVVKHSGEKKRSIFGKKVRAQIISGKVIRTISNVGGSTIVIESIYYDCETEGNNIRLTRKITKDGELVKEVNVYCGH